MKFFRNLFDSVGDVFLALIVLVIAVWVIVWRLEIVTGQGSEEGLLDHATVQEQSNEPENDSTIDDLHEDNDSLSNGQDSENGEDPGAENTADGEDTIDGTIELWAEGILLRDVDVTIPSGAASEATQPLFDAGLFESYDEYENLCIQLGKDPLLIKATSYTFLAGSTQEDILNELIN